MACVERLVPQLMGLIKAVGAVPIDFAAEAPVKAAAVRMPAELLKAVVPRLHSLKRELERKADSSPTHTIPEPIPFPTVPEPTLPYPHGTRTRHLCRLG